MLTWFPVGGVVPRVIKRGGVGSVGVLMGSVVGHVKILLKKNMIRATKIGGKPTIPKQFVVCIGVG